MENTTNKNINVDLLEDEDDFFTFINYEKIGEIFERDARRYNKYLGDDITKEKFI